MPHLIAVCGNMGAGKSTLCQQLSAFSGVHVLLEEPGSNPFLQRFYKDMPTWAFRSQLRFLVSRQRALLDAPPANLLIEDRSIHEDAFVFAYSLHEQGLMSGDEWALYRDVFEMFLAQRPPYDLVVRLKAAVPTLLERIAARGRTVEHGIVPGYLEQLQHWYDQLFASSPPARTIIDVDTSSWDMRSPTTAAAILAEIEKKL